MNVITRTLIGALVGTALMAGIAIAEPSRAQDPSGASFGCGYLACRTDSEDSGKGGTTNWAGSVAYRGPVSDDQLPVALVAQGWGMEHHDDQLSVSQGIVSLGIRAWIAHEGWVQVGLGVSRRQMRSERTGLVDLMETAPAATAGFGTELISTADFALKLAIHAGAGVVDEDELLVYNVSLGISGTY